MRFLERLGSSAEESAADKVAAEVEAKNVRRLSMMETP
jgi:hypothetical protein